MRTRLAALVAALVLVALGIAVGAGPLQGDTDRAAREAAEQRKALADRDARIEDLHRKAELGAAYTGATAGRAVSGRLADRKVAIITVPGADATTVDLLEGLVRAAGAEVTARVSLSETLSDRGSEGVIEALSSQMIEQTPGVGVPAGADGYQRIGALVARAVGVPPSARAASAPYDPTAIGIVSSLKAARLVDRAEISARAGLTIVVLPASSEESAVTALSGVLSGYGSQIPTVVAGPGAAAADGQLLAVLRSQGAPLSTVDSIDTPMGRVATVLALVARTRGTTGDYGVVGAVNAPVPPTS